MKLAVPLHAAVTRQIIRRSFRLANYLTGEAIDDCQLLGSNLRLASEPGDIQTIQYPTNAISDNASCFFL